MYDCIAAASYLYCGTHASVSQSPHLTSAAEVLISWFVSAAVTPFIEYLNVTGIGHCDFFEGNQF